jgi:hypothetical protein
MALLTGLIRDVARGRGGSVLIEGEPGIGKSALVQAAVAVAPEAGCQVFWGAGDELGQALPLLPFLDALRVREPSTNPRRKTIVQLMRGEVSADRGTDVPAVLAEQLLALVAEQCAMRPTILVIDDLQWADQASIILWGLLTRSARQVPLLLIGMMRPVPQRDDVLALRRAAGGATRLQLAGLAETAVADLVAELSGGRPDEGLPHWPAAPVSPSPRREQPSWRAAPCPGRCPQRSRTASASSPGRYARSCGPRPSSEWISRSPTWRSYCTAAWPT